MDITRQRMLIYCVLLDFTNINLIWYLQFKNVNYHPDLYNVIVSYKTFSSN